MTRALGRGLRSLLTAWRSTGGACSEASALAEGGAAARWCRRTAARTVWQDARCVSLRWYRSAAFLSVSFLSFAAAMFAAAHHSLKTQTITPPTTRCRQTEATSTSKAGGPSSSERACTGGWAGWGLQGASTTSTAFKRSPTHTGWCQVVLDETPGPTGRAAAAIRGFACRLLRVLCHVINPESQCQLSGSMQCNRNATAMWRTQAPRDHVCQPEVGDGDGGAGVWAGGCVAAAHQNGRSH